MLIVLQFPCIRKVRIITQIDPLTTATSEIRNANNKAVEYNTDNHVSLSPANETSLRRNKIASFVTPMQSV